MVHVWSTAALIASLCGSIVSSETTFRPMSMQLHRLPLPAVRSETYQRRRMVELDSHGDFEMVPLNPGMGTHYAWIYVGTPPQRASVITDTGSSILAFPCSGCTGCGKHTDQPFASLNSSTLEHVTCSNPSFFRCKSCNDDDSCQISQSYVEGSSWSATVVDDIVYLGDQASANDSKMRNQYGTRFKFGCQNRETGLFISQVADGIMGLSNNDQHVVAKLFKEKKIPSQLFTLCFTKDGGSMSIGAPDSSIHKGTIQYAKIRPNAVGSFYGVELRDIRLAGTSIEVPTSQLSSGRFIVDSGTTDSYLPSSIASAFNAVFKKVSGKEYHSSTGYCDGYEESELASLPNIEIVLEGENGEDMILTVTPHQYLFKASNGHYCANIYLTEVSGGVIGANIMTNRDVIFDQGQQRVGFVDADCAYRRLDTATNTNSTTNNTPVQHTGNDTTVVANTTAPVTQNETVTSAPNATIPATIVPVTTAPNTTTPATAAPNTTVPATTVPATVPAIVPATTAPVATAPATTVPATTVPAATVPATTVPTTTVPATTVPAATVPATTSPTTATPEQVMQDTPAPPATTPPKPKYPPGKHTGVHADTRTDGAAQNEEDGDHPMILSVVGSILAVAFLVVAIASVKRHNKKKRKSWSRVNEEDEAEDDDEDGLLEEIGERTRSPKRRAVRRSDDFDDEDANNDDDDDQHDHFHDEDDDDDDEIFASSTHAHVQGDEHRHDTRMLDRL